MDFYLTELTQNSVVKYQLRFPMNPETIAVTSGVAALEFDILGTGEVKLPNGVKLDTISWEAILPGAALKNAPYVKSWQDPKEIYKRLNNWMKSGTKLRLMVTETPILIDVCINELNPEFGSGDGSIKYRIDFYEAKDILIMTEKENAAKKTTNTTTTRPEPAQAKTYTVKPGDSLWKIALSQLKNGSRYTEIASLNQIKDPSKITPGQLLKLPSA